MTSREAVSEHLVSPHQVGQIAPLGKDGVTVDPVQEHRHPLVQEAADDGVAGAGSVALEGVEDAVALMRRHRNGRIVVVGDFDADGATSTALVLRCLRAMGFSDTDFLVPNRFDFGYGLSPGIVDVAMALQPDLIITVDNGIASIDGVARAREHGVPVLVTDHHLAGDELPAAEAIVNPNQPGCPFPSKHLAGVGVAFKFCHALLKAGRAGGRPAAEAVDLKRYLDLVALGIMLAVNLQTSFLTPPFGFSLFYLRGVTPEEVPTTAIYRGAIPFIVIQVVVLAGLVWMARPV